ncbi:MAG: VOC family protein [Propionibacteriaceae bacterium]|nr:VOC family protein [Propionibacteriaceae bacterium]
MTERPWDLQVAVDCDDPHELATWWAEALSWEVEPQDAEFIQSMVDQGFAQESEVRTFRGKRVWAAGAAVIHPDGHQPRLLFQRVPEGRTVKNRVHWDLRRPHGSPTSEDVERLVTMGAQRIGEGQQGPHSWVVLADPEGNEFCV